MTRDRTARIRVRQHLSAMGPVEDPSGYATNLLKDAIGYLGSGVAFIQLIAAMDRDGEISRSIRGKRTYRIALEEAGRVDLPAPNTAAGPVTAGMDSSDAVAVIDYDKLARAIVREFYQFAAEGPHAVAPADDVDSRRSKPAPPDVSLSEHERIAAERDEYARRLEIARGKLDELLGGDPGRSVVEPAAADR